MLIGLTCLVFWTIRFSYCWLRDYGNCTPLADTPCCSSQKHPYFVSVIASLRLRSWFWLIPFPALFSKKVMARSESTWLGILTPIQVNVPYDRLFSCLVSWRINCSLHFYWTETPVLWGGVDRKSVNLSKKARRVKKCVHVRLYFRDLIKRLPSGSGEREVVLHFYWTRTPVLMWVIWPGNCIFSWKRPKLLKRVNNLGYFSWWKLRFNFW